MLTLRLLMGLIGLIYCSRITANALIGFEVFQLERVAAAECLESS